MSQITVDLQNEAGKIKPMHGVNNGPVHSFAPDHRISNLDAYRAAGIPYARTHDASFDANYGGAHTVDIHGIFPNFDADPYDPASYDFPVTDYYLKTIAAGGAEVFYRLGAKIEHEIKKYDTLPPKDFHKWAVICEHIIRHYNEGWCDGMHMGIRYWEIWNEPDLDRDDSVNKRTWGGTAKQYFELYDIAATHLKQCFPDLKIGGPALAYRLDWAEEFLAQLKAPLDFFSWHIYATTPEKIGTRAQQIREMLDRHGFAGAESILNEWNYVKGWFGEEFVYTVKTIKSLKGASFTAATMCCCQYRAVDSLMYYDARPCRFNGLFDTDFADELLKGYYPFPMFNELYRRGTALAVSCDEPELYLAAAKGAHDAAVLLTYYRDGESAPDKETELLLKGFDGPVKVRCYLLNRSRDNALVREEILKEGEPLRLTVSLFSTYLLVCEKHTGTDSNA